MRRTGSGGYVAGMEMALRLARAAAVREEVPVGAVILQEGAVLAEAHNQTLHLNDPTAHAELIVIREAMKRLGQDRLSDATLFVTLEPCAQCAGAIVLAKVGRVVFGAYDNRCGWAGSVGDILRHPLLNHRPEVVGGILADECGELLKSFFRERR